MGLLCDKQIRELVEKTGMIDPFIDHSIREDGVLSYGLSSFGYDVRVAPEFKVFDNVYYTNYAYPTNLKNGKWPMNEPIDPKKFNPRICREVNDDVCIIPPNGFVLGRTVEYFTMPDDVMSICIGKSTYARCGILINVTPIEPGSKGHVVLEFSNTTPYPAKIYANEGACQFLFFKGDGIPEVTYASKKGKYLGQTGVTLPKVEK